MIVEHKWLDSQCILKVEDFQQDFLLDWMKDMREREESTYSDGVGGRSGDWSLIYDILNLKCLSDSQLEFEHRVSYVSLEGPWVEILIKELST